MIKIFHVFKRENHKYTSEVELPWVFEEPVIATRKWDGTACMFQNGLFYKRFTLRKGTPPEDFIPTGPPFNGKQTGWVLVKSNDKYHWEGLENHYGMRVDGTYELCGPKVNGNPEHLELHLLIKHGQVTYPDFPLSFEDIPKFFDSYPPMEGVVLYGSGGKMAKIRRKLF